jgi:hypothetical protein
LIKPFLVADDFDDDKDDRQHKKYYAMNGWHVAFFEIKRDGLPRYYSSQLGMAEIDSGGFGDFLQDLWNKVEFILAPALGSAAAGAVGAALGSAIPGLGTVIGAVIGAFISWLVGLFHNGRRYRRRSPSDAQTHILSKVPTKALASSTTNGAEYRHGTSRSRVGIA